MKLLAVGSMAFDAIETPFGKTDKILGGAGSYIGLTASVFGVKTALVSVVGGDFQEELKIFKDRNINIDGVEVKPEGKSFFWSGKYHNDLNSRDTLITELNVLADFQPKVPAHAQDSDILLLGNLDPAVQLSVLEQMSKRPSLVVLDTMNFWMDIALDNLKKVMQKVDVISINDEEARQLSGEYSLVKAAEKIHQMGPKFVIIKKGEHGALLFHSEGIFAIPALPLKEVFDPTGAGDSFAGGFVAHLAKTENLSFDNMKLAVIIGSAMASFTVECFGTERLLEVTPELLKTRVEEFKKLTSFEVEF